MTPSDEFRLIQDKLDHIGDFRFRVRGWVITLVTALFTAGLTREIPWHVYLLAELPVLGFHFMERAQSIWQSVLVTRASILEEHLRSHAEWPAPGIVAGFRERRRRLRHTRMGRIVLHDERNFYTMMYILPLLAAALAAPWCSLPFATVVVSAVQRLLHYAR